MDITAPFKGGRYVQLIANRVAVIAGSTVYVYVYLQYTPLVNI